MNELAIAADLRYRV